MTRLRRYALKGHRRKPLATFLVLVIGLLAHQTWAGETAPSPAERFQLSVTPYPYNTDLQGNDLPIEIGRFQVPIVRGDPDATGTMEVGYVRYLAEKEESDSVVIILADDRKESVGRQEFYKALRRTGDVVEFSHRGFRLSPLPILCEVKFWYPMSEPLNSGLLDRSIRSFSEGCLSELENSGIPRQAFHHREIAADLRDLATLLGKDRIFILAEDWLVTVAGTAASKYPDIFTSFILVNLPIVPTQARDLWDTQLNNLALGSADVSFLDDLKEVSDTLALDPDYTIFRPEFGRPVLISFSDQDLAYIVAMTLGHPPFLADEIFAAIRSYKSGEVGGIAYLALRVRQSILADHVRMLISAANGYQKDSIAASDFRDQAVIWATQGPFLPDSQQQVTVQENLAHHRLLVTNGLLDASSEATRAIMQFTK